MEGLSKTPDEIKKGLECCNTGKTPACELCNYKSFELGPHGVHYVNYHCKQLQIDALAYIRQLEADNAELLEKNKKLTIERDKYFQSLRECCYKSRCDKTIKELTALCNEKDGLIQQLERERDALLKALKCTDIDCGHCKHCNTMEDVCQCDCSDCELDADKCPCNK